MSPKNLGTMNLCFDYVFENRGSSPTAVCRYCPRPSVCTLTTSAVGYVANY